MTCGQYDPVAVGPIWRCRCMFQSVLPQRVRGRRQSHRRARMSTVGAFDGVDRQESDCIYRPPCGIAVDGGYGNSLDV